MNLKLLCEGNWDGRIGQRDQCEGALRILVTRIISENIKRPLAHSEVTVGRLPKLTKGGGFKRKITLAIREANEVYDSLVVVVDRDGPEFDGRLHELNEGVAAMSGKAIAARTVTGMAVEELEAWLIADHNVLTRRFRATHGVPNPEDQRDPKAIFLALLDNAGVERNAGYDIAARETEIMVVSNKCNSFRRFADDLRRRIT